MEEKQQPAACRGTAAKKKNHRKTEEAARTPSTSLPPGRSGTKNAEPLPKLRAAHLVQWDAEQHAQRV